MKLPDPKPLTEEEMKGIIRKNLDRIRHIEAAHKATANSKLVFK